MRVGEAGTGRAGDGQRQRAATFECPDCIYVFTKGEPFVLEDRLAMSRCGVCGCGVPPGKNLESQAPWNDKLLIGTLLDTSWKI